MWSGREIDAAIIAHTPLVRRLAHFASRRLPASVDVDDLVQAGMLGLLEAATRFDPTQGIAFESFASARIRGAFLDELRELDWMPRSVRKAQRDIAAAVREVEKQVGRAAREQEVAVAMGLTLAAYQRLVAEAQAPGVVEIDAAAPGDDPFLDRHVPDGAPGPDERFAEKRLHSAIARQLTKLSERHKLLMRFHYDDDLTFRAIAERWGVTESRICQLHAEVVLALRRGLHAHGALPVPPKPAKPLGRRAARERRLALAAKRTAAALAK